MLPAGRDLVVVSDFHLGRGRNPASGRFHRLETFFFDEELRRFCTHLIADADARQAGLTLVLNGDTFDLLRIEEDEVDHPPVARATELVRRILAGHPGVVAGLAAVLAAGHEVVFLPGNHDLELQWTAVQAEVRGALRSAVAAGGGDADAADARLTFAPWFHYEPGRIWIEHGSQYDPEGAFRYPLRTALESNPHALANADRDLPLGNFFQRYLYNAFGAITFIVPSTSANVRYFRWLALHRPRVLSRVIARHAPFLWRLLRRLARSRRDGMTAVHAAHRAELERLAASTGLGATLHLIDDGKEVRGDVVQAVRQVGAAMTRGTLLAATVLLLGVAIWSAGFQAITALALGVGGKALLLVALNVIMLAIGGLGLVYLLLRTRPPRPRTMPRAAQRIAGLLDVPLIVFGHTHEETVLPLATPRGRGWYFNTGTWIGVFTHDVLVPRERVQFTFLRARGGHEAELLHWRHGEIVPVVLLDD